MLNYSRSSVPSYLLSSPPLPSPPLPSPPLLYFLLTPLHPAPSRGVQLIVSPPLPPHPQPPSPPPPPPQMHIHP
uniref:Uncharacterized protein n=1 Tax=Echinococcus granulosus TaxID=6210 RepID=A0A068WRK7_ECHGR|nr:hypothetical protein EgrG_000247200 [Echinococcus granulosus]